MRVRVFSVLTILPALALLAGCASDSGPREYYEAVEPEPLEIPEGLAQPTSSAALVINAPPMPLSPMPTESKPPRISSTTSGLDSNSSFKWSAQGLYLLVDDSPESVQQGVYRFDYYQTFGGDDAGLLSRMAFWKRDDVEDYSGAYQAFIQPDGQQTRVYVKYADGTDCEPDAAEHILDVVRSRLG